MAFPDPTVMPATGIGNKSMTIVSLHGPTSYLTGGVIVGAATFLLQKLDFVEPMELSTDALSFVRIVSTPVAGGAATVKVLWLVAATGLEVGNGTNLSAKRITCLALGN